MKIQSKMISKKPFIIVAALVVLLIVAALIYVYGFNHSIFGWNDHNTSSNDKPSFNLDKPTDEQIKAGNDIKKENATKSDSSVGTPPTPGSQASSNKQNVEVIITSANQNAGMLQVRSQISTIVNTGQCTLVLSKAGSTVTKTSDVQALASFTTCKGFDIPVSELSAGSWQATLTYENDSLVGTASTIITIQ